MKRWYEEYPERLEFELRALRDAGYDPIIDEKEMATGVVVLRVDCPINESVHQLRIVFPPQYPYFSFRIFAPTLSLARHQDPYSKELCFVAKIESEWRTDDTVAKYLQEQLPKVLRANDQNGSEEEAREGAPVTGYLRFEPESVVLIGDINLSPDHDRGSLTIGLERGNNPHEAIRGAVIEIHDEAGVRLARASDRIAKLYLEKPLTARWVRLPKRPSSDKPEDILAEAVGLYPDLRKPNFAGPPDVLGIVFRDEARYGELHDLWIFLVRALNKHRRAPGSAGNITKYVARADSIGRDELSARVPRLKPLSSTKIVVFGLGALGSIAAWQLARAGVGQLVLVDFDVVDAGTMPRWLFGLAAVGRHKVQALASWFAANYPHVDAAPIFFRVGAVTSPPELGEGMMASALEGADLIIDCTAELTVNHYLSSLSWDRGVPYVWASGRPGAWGGAVGRAMPGKTSGCWKCSVHHREDGTYPSPEQEEVPSVQPIGCFSPTFTGTGFDLDVVSNMATRLAIATLCCSTAEGYPDFDWDVGVVNVWKNGKPVAPEWNTHRLIQHPDCDRHR